jgi:hypothetical protein
MHRTPDNHPKCLIPDFAIRIKNKLGHFEVFLSGFRLRPTTGPIFIRTWDQALKKTAKVGFFSQKFASGR